MKNSLVTLRRVGALTLALMASVATTHASPAELSHFVTPSYRGLADTEWAIWDNFTVANGAPGNLPDFAGSTGNGTITQNTTGAFLTSGGNIYSFSVPTAFTVADSTPFTLGTVTFQADTLGTLLDYNSVLLRYDNGGGLQTLATTRTELYNSALGGFGGSEVTSLWQWNVSALGINSFDIVFNASGSSMSFAAAALDTVSVTTVVPEPTVSGLLAGAGALMFIGRFRRKK